LIPPAGKVLNTVAYSFVSRFKFKVPNFGYWNFELETLNFKL
jgi:hypothetical protein